MQVPYVSFKADHSSAGLSNIGRWSSSNELFLTGHVLTWYVAVFYCIDDTSCLTFHLSINDTSYDHYKPSMAVGEQTSLYNQKYRRR
jgi:hypothetical protein